VHPGLTQDDEPASTLPVEVEAPEAAAAESEGPERYISWAELMKRVHGLEVLKCPCGGTKKVKARVRDPQKARERLVELGLWKEPPRVAKARGPPQGEFFDRRSECDGVDPPAPEAPEDARREL
jgi:hypothetical protein